MHQLQKLCLLWLLYSCTSYGQSLLDYEQRSLNDLSARNLQTLVGKPSLILFFEPDCSWCYKQTKVFNRLYTACREHLNIVGLGVNGNQSALKKEAWRLKARFPLFMAGHALVKDMGGVSATPFTLVLNQQGGLQSHAKGYLSPKKLAAFSEGLNLPSCLHTALSS